MRYFYFILLTALLLILPGVQTSNSEVPRHINYQGFLTDISGEPVEDGIHEMEFVLYSTESAETDIWSSGLQDVSTKNGLFIYRLGSNIPLPTEMIAASSCWLGIRLEGDTEILPRTELLSVPFAHRSKSCDTAAYARGTEFDYCSESFDARTSYSGTVTVTFPTPFEEIPYISCSAVILAGPNAGNPARCEVWSVSTEEAVLYFAYYRVSLWQPIEGDSVQVTYSAVQHW